MKKLAILFAGLLLVHFAHAEGYKAGDRAIDFRLKNVDGKMVSLSDFPDTKGFVVVFTCNACPYAVAYQDRIIAIDKKYKSKGYPVIAINPNDPEVSPKDGFEEMKVRAREKAFPFPYLFDERQEVFPVYGASRTPHIYLLNREGKELVVKYVGAIDDNYKDASQVGKTYLADAIDALIAGKNPEITETKAIGCSIKVKK